MPWLVSVLQAWPLLSVYPIATASFWMLYHFGWTPISKWMLRGHAARTHAQMTSLSDRMWRANCNSCLHSVLVVVLLGLMFVTDDGKLWTTRIEPYYNSFGYSAMCVSLGYFSFAIPWQHRIFFCERRRYPDAIQYPIVVHHLLVVAGALVYVVSCTCALYGAVAFACMEFTNWFFVPWTMLEMLGLDGTTAHQALGVTLIASYLVFRIVICTWQGISFVVDLVAFIESDPGPELAAVLLACACYAFALLLSWAWLGKVYRGLRDGVAVLLSQRRASRAVQPAPPSVGTQPGSPTTTTRTAMRPYEVTHEASHVQNSEEVRSKPPPT